MVGDPLVTAGPFPVGACDTHVHFYDARCPSVPTAILRPPDATVDQYLELRAALGLTRVVVVQPSTYGYDHRCQLAAVAELGPDARLVAVVDETVADDELERLTRLGARGARFHMLPGGVVPWESLAPTAARIAPFGWHIQLQMNGRELGERIDVLLDLPTPLVVDHVGRFMPPVDVADEHFGVLLRLVDTGRCWVKLSAPYESAADDSHAYDQVTAMIDALVERAPERMLWASNWPHPGQLAPPGPDDLRLLALRWMPSASTRRRIMVDNPAELYGFGPVIEEWP
jgi:D-galactarolactone isomerase